MKKIFIVLLIFIFTINTTNAWLGLIAQTGDILNVAKWNELVADKLSRINLKAGTGITLTTSGDDIFVNSFAVPYITTNVKQNIAISRPSTIYIDGVNFVPSSTVSIPGFDGTIDSVNVVSPIRIEVSLTPGATIADYNIVVSNDGVLNTQWAGNGNLLLGVVNPVVGTGLAGTYLEDFEAGQGSWVDSGLTGSWTRDSGGTPSNGTGPTTGAGGSTWYMYTEVSNGANANDFGIETTNFARATSISLDYHMFGPDIGTLYIQVLRSGVWTTVWSISGEQQANQTDPYINTGNIDLTSYEVESIRILMNGATSWGGDTAVDNISITSD